MAYTSGRTVKSGVKNLSPVAAATAATRKAIKDVVGNTTGITINTRHGYDLVRNIDTLISVVTYPAGTNGQRIRYEIMAELDTMNVTADAYGMVITRRA